MKDLHEINDKLAEMQESDEPPVQELVEFVISNGIEQGASDIHVEPTENEIRIRFRLDGVLQNVATINSSLQPNIVARIKVLSDLLTYRTDIPQEGRIESERHGGDVDLRVSTFPTIHGEKVVVRIFDPQKKTFLIDQLGFPSDIQSGLEKLFARPQGVILLTGPSGSGKTTTIYSALTLISEKGRGTKNIVTIEDPVEYSIPDTTQTQINLPADLTFAKSLRSLLRQDPEVIMIGEIRDPETAKIAIEAGLTGHLVISTIHSGRACGVFNRLLDMNVEPFLITSAVTAVLAQRLVRVLCPSCRRRIDQAEESEFEGLRDVCDGTAYKPIGCAECFETGYQGRTLLAELLLLNQEMRNAILEKSEESVLEKIAIESGMRTLLDEAVAAIKAGKTSPEELRRVLVF